MLQEQQNTINSLQQELNKIKQHIGE
jgi:hypothetical protein